MAATGAKAWSQGYGSVVPYPFAATADTVFVEMIPLNPAVGCEDKAALVSVEAIQASNSTVTWSTELPAGICARPILGDGALYVITYAGGYTAGGGYTPYTATLLALDVRDGMPLWRLALDTLPDGGPVLSDGALYAVVQPRPPNNGPPTYTIVAFKASDGMLLWQRRTPVDDPVVSSNVVRNGAARLLAGDGMVFYVYRDQLAELQGSASSMGIAALRASDGTAAWQQPVPYRFDGLQTVQAGLLYFSDVAPPSDQQNHPSMILHSFDAHSGALIFERQLPPTRQFYSNDVPNTAVSDTYRLATLGITGGVVVLSGYAEHYASHSLWGSGTGIVGFILGVGASDGTLRWAHTLGRDVPFSALMLAP